MITSIVINSDKNMFAVNKAKNGTEKINTLTFTGPSIGVQYK